MFERLKRFKPIKILKTGEEGNVVVWYLSKKDFERLFRGSDVYEQNDRVWSFLAIPDGSYVKVIRADLT